MTGVLNTVRGCALTLTLPQRQSARPMVIVVRFVFIILLSWLMSFLIFLFLLSNLSNLCIRVVFNSETCRALWGIHPRRGVWLNSWYKASRAARRPDRFKAMASFGSALSSIVANSPRVPILLFLAPFFLTSLDFAFLFRSEVSGFGLSAFCFIFHS